MPQQKLENKSNRHKKLIGTIEKCLLLYKEKNVDVVSIEQIRGWINDNYRNGISKRRLSVFLYRRPQFDRVAARARSARGGPVPPSIGHRPPSHRRPDLSHGLSDKRVSVFRGLHRRTRCTRCATWRSASTR